MVSHNEALKKIGVSTQVISNRIVKAYSSTSPADRIAGEQWYSVAQKHCKILAEIGGISEKHSAAVISHLSPRTTWKRNIEGAYSLVTLDHAPHCMSANVNRARQALKSPDPFSTINGPKTKSFAKNMVGEDAATIDVWVLRALDLDDKQLNRSGVYDALAHCFSLASIRLGIPRSQIQAAIWCWIRNGRAI